MAGLRFVLITLFVISVAFILNHDRIHHTVRKYHAQKPFQFSTNTSTRPYYKKGSIRNVDLPSIPFLNRLNRKKINNFIFNHYNQYRMELTFIDMGYSSLFKFTFYSDSNTSFQFNEKLGFTLSEAMMDGSMNLKFQKKQFNLTVLQNFDVENDLLITNFNISSLRLHSKITANLTHIIRNQDCLTAIRGQDVITHRCFGGLGTGRLAMENYYLQKNQDNETLKRNSLYNLSLNVTRVIYDGLRGSGMHWQWTWGVASGFSKKMFYDLHHSIPREHSISISFGSLNGAGEDVLFLNGTAYPMKGLSYTIDEESELNTNITLTCIEPVINANFTILQKFYESKDQGFLKFDRIVLRGDWAGTLKVQEDNEIQFFLILGHIEITNSLF